MSAQASYIPYFSLWRSFDVYEYRPETHLVVCVHGLDGTCIDLRMVRAFLELGLPDADLEFLMSESNQVCVHGLDGTCIDLRMVRAFLELGLPDADLEFLMSESNQVCVHGLDGTCIDLRMVRAFLELGLPDADLEFLMSESNQVCVHGLDGTCIDLRMVRAFLELGLPDADLEFLMSESNQVCVHGLDGTCIDLRMVRAFLELGLPDADLEFLMSESNQDDTFADFDTLSKNLANEIVAYLTRRARSPPRRISFIGHSLGTVIIRGALTDRRLAPYLDRLHAFLSLNGPHCGIMYNTSGLINVGMWLMQRWKKSASLQQLAMKDSADIRQCFLYRLSKQPGLELFKYVLLVGSYQDYYVPLHSAHIEFCKSSLKDTSSLGSAYMEMVVNLLHPVMTSSKATVIRYSAFHTIPTASTSNLIGRAAHIAVLDSDLFIEKLLSASGLQYFR